MLNQSKFHLDKFSKEYKFWEGEWKAVWLSNNEGKFERVAESVHKVFSTLDGKVLIETAQGEASDDQAGNILSGSFAGFSMRYLNKKSNRWVMIQSWPDNNGSNISTLSGLRDRARIEVFANIEIEKVLYTYKYTFSDISVKYFRWDMQISKDEQKTWSLPVKVHFDKISEEFEVSEGHNLWSFRNGELGQRDNLPILMEGKSLSGQIKDVENSIDASLDIYRMTGGCGYLLHFQESTDSPDKFQELLFIGWGSRRNWWNMIIVDNSEKEHRSFHSNGYQLEFENFSEFNIQSFGEDVDYGVRIKSEDDKFSMEFIKENNVIKSYLFQ